MIIRRTEGSLFASFRTEASSLRDELAKLTVQLSSGRRIQRPSDDPAAAMEAVRLNAALARQTQYGRAQTAAADRLAKTESALAGVTNTFTQARVLALEGAGLQTEAGRAGLAQQMEGLFQDLLASANTQDGSRYLFAGFTIQSEPFQRSGSFSGTVPPASSITVGYGGTSDATEAEIAPGDRVTVGWPGDQVFLGGGDPNKDLFQILVRARDAILAGDTTAVNQELGNLNSALDSINAVRSEVGVELARVQKAEDLSADRQVELKTHLGEVEGIDFVQLVGELQERQTAYQAALSAGAKVLGQSLMDFLG